MPRCPAILIAAPASGQGKTTVTAALARLHTRQGRRVRVFKCGPDFLDPHWHQLASGAPVHQLDGWMTGPFDMAARLYAAAQEADLILIEGVMGLFDGTPSAADLAARLGVPVLVVVDASAMAGTFGALVYGLVHYQPGLRWAGVLANRVASAHHAHLLREGLREPTLWQGALARVEHGADKSLLPERHLGLVAAHELHDAQERLDAAADALAPTPLGQKSWADWQDWAVDFPAPSSPIAADETPGPWLQGRTVAVARDAAFSFIYPANLDCLAAMGAQLAFFSPLAGDALPLCDAVWLPGGYPELHAPALRANQVLQDGLRAHMAAAKPLWAECGGMVALCEGITDREGVFQPLWGLLPGRATLQPRLAGLGMQQLQTDIGVVRGHTFHYSRFDTPMPALTRSSRPGQPVQSDQGEALYQHASVHASYFHAWFASNPRAVAAWLGAPMAPANAAQRLAAAPSPIARSELILGGQKSGKSRRAELLAQAWLAQSPQHQALLIATAEPWDDEMHARIARHQRDRAERVPGMRTLQEPHDLAAALQTHSQPHTLIVVDCLTLWLTHWTMPADSAAPPSTDNVEPNQALALAWQAQAALFLEALAQAPGPVVLVGNEIGLGVIPLGREVRAFVDALGQLNQQVAQVCARVTLMAAGLPLTLKDL